MPLGAQPNVLPIFVNNDAAETNSRQVSITLTKEDVSSWGSIGSITGVQISEDPDFHGAAWLPWSQRTPFTLSTGNGTKTVYVRFKDNQNRIVGSSDTILFYEPVPRLSVSQNQITFLAEVGAGQPVQSSLPLIIENTGGDILHWTASDNRDWLTLDSTSGDAPATINLRVNNAVGILNSVGTKTGTITVNATNPNAIDTPQTILVAVSVVEELDSTYLPFVSH